MRKCVSEIVEGQEILVNFLGHTDAIANELSLLDQIDFLQNIIIKRFKFLCPPKFRIWTISGKKISTDNIVQQLIHEQVSTKDC